MRKAFFSKIMVALFFGLSIFLFSFNNPGALKCTACETGQAPITDTSVYVIIAFTPSGDYPFSKKYKSATLTTDDIESIDSLFKKSVGDYNSSLKIENKADFKIDLSKEKYKRQYIPVLNEKGEKEVWVNCFCSYSFGDRWKKEIVLVMDGGSCYFNFKINLATKKVYEFSVNGEA